MAQIIFKKAFEAEMATLDKELKDLNARKLRLLFDALQCKVSNEEVYYLLGLTSATISVPDRGMCIQLNGFCRTIPNVRFVVDTNDFAFVFRDLERSFPF